MVRRILSRLGTPVRGLHQAAYLLAGLTLASQLLALLRDRMFARAFGAGDVLDLYYAAFKIPDLIYALVVSLVSAYVLIPRLSRLRQEEDVRAARMLVSQSATFLLCVGGVVCLVAAIAAPSVLRIFFPTLAALPEAENFVLLTRLLLLQPLLLGVSSILSSVTQLERRFMLFALSPVLYNLGIIFGAALLYPRFGIIGIGMGVIAGALLHLMLHVPVAARARLLPRPVLPRWSVLWPVFRDSVPRSMALAMGSITALLLVALASRQGEGAVAVYTLAGNLEAVPLSLVGAAYATAAFPVMSELASERKYEALRTVITAAARHVIFWSSVIAVLAIVLRAHIVRIVLGTGAFDWDDTRLTAAILAVLVVSLVAQGLILLCARAFYASGRSWNPLLVQLGDAGVSIASAWGMIELARMYPMIGYFMESLLRIEGVPSSSVLYVAVGFTIGQLIMGIVALATLRTVAPGVAGSLSRPLFEGLGAAILGGAACYVALSIMGAIAPLTSLAIVFTEGVIAGMVGLLVSGCVLAVLENQEFRDLVASLRKLTSFSTLSPYDPIHDRTDP